MHQPPGPAQGQDVAKATLQQQQLSTEQWPRFVSQSKRGRSEHLGIEDVESSRDNFSGIVEFRVYSIPVEKNVDESFLRISYLTFRTSA